VTVLNFTGAESGDFVEAVATSGTVSVQTAVKHSGEYAYRCNPTAAAGTFTIRGLGADGKAATLGRTAATYYSFWFLMAALPAAEEFVGLVSNSGGSGVVILRVNSSGQLTLSGTSTSSVIATLAANTWYQIRMKIVSNGTSECDVDGGTPQSITASNQTQDQIIFGDAGGTFDFFYDDIVIDDAGFPIASATVARMDADGAGTDTGWTGTFADVDEIPHDSGSTFINSTSTSAAETVTLESAVASGAAGTIAAVKQGAVMAEASSTVTLAGLRLRSGATTSDTTPADVGTTTYVLFSRVFVTDPNTATTWTNAALDALQVGVLKGNDADDVRCTSIWAMVLRSNSAPIITVGPTVAYAGSSTGVSSVATPATVTFTATDAEQTGADELTWQIRTATGGGGTLVASGTATQAISEVASIDYNDSGIIDGSQTLYLLVSDGVATDEESFSFNRIIIDTKSLDLRWGVGGFASRTADLRWGVGGLARKNLILLYEVAPSPLRVTYALSGEYGPVIAPLRFERRTVANVFLEDVTHAILGCHIEGNNNRTIFRTATFAIDPQEADINPLTDHIAVFTDLTVDGNYVFTMQWGLFALTIPRKSFSPVEGGIREVWEVEANDNTIHLLETTFEQEYTVAAGQNYITGTNAVADILDSAGVPHALPNSTATLPNAMSWPAGTPKMIAVNKLLEGINHLSAKPDSTGTFRTRESTDLNTRTPDVTYNDTDFVLIPITEEVETTRFANKVIVTSGNLVAVATNDDPDSPISTVSLGRTYTRVVTVDAAADQTAIDAIAAQYLRDAASLYRRATLLTQPDPRREANEVYALSVDGLYVDEKWAAQSWAVDLTPQPKPQMTHTISKVSPVAVTV